MYFTQKEHDETIRKKKIGKVEVEKREPYKYECSKAIYDGEWLGGMRHGTGRIKWSDGSIYQGQWCFNVPGNEGKFFYCNGDIYEGGW